MESPFKRMHHESNKNTTACYHPHWCATHLLLFSLFPYLTLPAFNVLPILSLVSGIAVIVFAIKSFKDYKTTINPLKPETASSLVTSGVFKYTRNPMYLGLLLILIYLSLIFNVVGGCLVSLGFIIYITKFQIIPEELPWRNYLVTNFLNIYNKSGVGSEKDKHI